MLTSLRHAALALALAAPFAGHASSFTTLGSLTGSGDGAVPESALVQVGNLYYGTTSSGGPYGFGTVFAFNPATGAETVLHAFGPNAGSQPDGHLPEGPLLNVGGTLYGITGFGGGHGYGTVYSINPATGAESTIYSFQGFYQGAADAALPTASLTSLGGMLYGVSEQGGTDASGTVFQINPATGAESVLYSFKVASGGWQPQGALVAVNGRLYGTTAAGGAGSGNGSGTIFQLDPATGAETVLHDFNNPAGLDGFDATAGLINVGNTLYGTTEFGGANGGGTVFAFNLTTGVETVLHSFANPFFGPGDGAYPNAPLMVANGLLYGTTETGGAHSQGTVFAVNPGTGIEKLVASFSGLGGDGASPFGALVQAGNLLYGTTSLGGSANEGTIFQVNLASGAEKPRHGFTGADGQNEGEGLSVYRGTPLAAVGQGGAAGRGAVYKINRSTGAVTTLSGFTGAGDAIGPNQSLAQIGDAVYGVTLRGGADALGTVFQLNPGTGGEKILHGFAGGADGASPQAPLLAYEGKLYGTTNAGGVNGVGTLFEVNPATGAETVLLSLTRGGTGGAQNPLGGLVAFKGLFYGTTTAGGVNGQGSIYSFDRITKSFTTVYSFTGGADGGNARAALLTIGGIFYGTTANGGGVNGDGTVFSFNPATGVEAVLYRFAGGTDGAYPQCTLISQGGVLYGTTTYGGTSFQGWGTVFALNIATGAKTTLYNFNDGADGGYPNTGLVQAGGTLYGANAYGGTAGLGTLFSLVP